MKPVLPALLFSAAALAGPLTIQTQEAVWSNGLDTITLGAATVEGPGAISIPFSFEFTSPGPRLGSISIAQDATIGDNDSPFQLLYTANYQVFSTGGMATFQLVLNTSYAPYEDDPDRIVRFINGSNSPVFTSSPLNGNVPIGAQVATPEPSTMIFLGLGLGLIALRRLR